METQAHNTQKFLQQTAPSFYQSKNAQKQLIQYQKNMKIFIKTVEKQTSALIDRYETQIRQLKAEIKKLQNQLYGKNGTSNPSTIRRDKDFGFDFGISTPDSCQLSPIRHKKVIPNFSGIETARSNFLEQFPIKNFFGSQLNNFNTEMKFPNFDHKFQLNKTSDKLNKSRFQVESKKKRQRQQDLLHYLQTGRNNLQSNTDKMFSLIGKSRMSQSDKKNVQNQQQKQIQTPTKKRKGSLAHNQSLSSICQSLNNSFHAKKSQAKSQKKRKQQEIKQQQQSRKEQQRQKRKKQQGIKNLLTTMRKNISTSLDKPAQIIKGSKLLSTGESPVKPTQAPKAKVMINPVPIDLAQRNKQKQQNSNRTKNPQSILKNSSTNFLTKSIENISAISFHSSGNQQ